MMRYRSSRMQQETRLVTVDYLIYMVKVGRLDPSPIFGYLPNSSNMIKSQIVESLILGLSIETIWTEEDALGKTQLLSGFEMLSSILDFNDNHFHLRGLRILKHLEGLLFSETAYAEQKQFMQMDVSLSVIHHDSDPMVKCLFVENINRAKYGANAAQIARNIIFKRAENNLSSYTQKVFNKLKHDKFMNRRNFKRYYLKFQTEMLYCLLLIYLKQNNSDFKDEVSMESYSYSRSHISNYTDYDNLEINFNDVLENAINKLMFILEVDSYRLHQELELLEKMINEIFENHNINLNTMGKIGFNTNRYTDSFFNQVYHLILHDSCPLRINSLTSIRSIMEQLEQLK